MEHGLLDEDEARRVLVIKQNRGSRGFVAAKKEVPSLKDVKPASMGKPSVKGNPSSQNGVFKPKDVKGGGGRGPKPKRRKEEDSDDSEEAIPLKKLRK